MDPWLLLILFTFFAALFLSFFLLKRKRLPPGPPAIPILGNLLWFRRSLTDIEQIVNELLLKYGPFITLRMGSYPYIFISDSSLAYKALMEHGTVFADRPPPAPATRFLNSNQHNISSASYGPLWRLFRRNLTSQILHPTKVLLFAPGREWVLDLLLRDLQSKSQESLDGTVVAMESFKFAMFSLLVLMCFGEKLDASAIREIEAVHTKFLAYNGKLNIFFFVPRIAKYVFHQTWKTIVELRQRQIDMFVPLIRVRTAQKENGKCNEGERFVHSYVDSLLDIQLPEEDGRGLTEDEIVALCSEFLTAGTDTTTTALQWIMAELVKHQEVQRKLLREIERVMAQNDHQEVKEEDLQGMPYLKAVIMEGLRCHPPGHFVVPHSVTKDVEFEGYLIPKNASINFLVANIGLDGKLWEKPKEFMPERFMAGGDGEGVDITGSRGIKMMPFGVGRRICPGIGLAMLHLEYFIASLVKEFEWTAIDEEEIDFSEKTEFLVVMRTPLKARISRRAIP